MLTDNNSKLMRRLLLAPLAVFGFASIIATGGSSGSEDGDAGGGGPIPSENGAAITLSSEIVAVTRGDTKRVRVDVEGLPEGQGITGFSIDLSEVASRIDIQTEACPAGAGTPSCRDFAIAPATDSTPGDYIMQIASVGAPSAVATADLRIRVIGDLPPRQAALIASERLVVTADGRLWARGANFVGQAGIGFWNACTDRDHHCLQPSETNAFVPVGTGTDWADVATSSDTTVAVRIAGGSVWAWGENAYGALGYESEEGRELAPTLVPGFGAPVTHVSIGRGTSEGGPRSYLARTSLSNVYAWGGWRGSGLVNGTLVSNQQPRIVPQAVSAEGVETPLFDVTDVAGGTSNTGNGFALARKSDGSVWQWGGGEFYGVNDDDEFEARPGMARVVNGLGSARSIAVGTRPVADSPGLGFALVATTAGEVFAWDEESQTPQPVAGLSNIVAVSADHSENAVALDGNGAVWTWAYGRSSPQMQGGLPEIVRLGKGNTLLAIAGDCDSASGSLWSLAAPGGTARREPRFGEDCATPTAFNLRMEITGEGTAATNPPYVVCNNAVCATSVPAGARLGLTYVPAPGWRNTDSSCSDSVILDADRTCTAIFELRPLPKTLAVTLTDAGRVTSSPAGIDCPNDCTQTYPPGGTAPAVTLTAIAERGYQFVAMRGDPECADRTFTMEVSRQCDAIFEPFPTPGAPTGLAAAPGNDFVQLTWTVVPDRVIRYAISRSEGGGAPILIGEIGGGAASFRDNNVVPGREYTWRLVAINASGSSPPATVTATTQTPLNVTLTVQVDGPGRVTSAPAGIDCPGDCTQSYSLVTNVTLTAAPGNNARFDRWDGACAGTQPTLLVTMDDNKTCTARFTSTGAGGWITLAAEIAASVELPLYSSVVLTSSGGGFIAYLQTVQGQNRLSVRRIATGFPPLGLALNGTATWNATSPNLVVDSADVPIMIFAVDLSEIWVARWNANAVSWELLRPDPGNPQLARLNLTASPASRPRMVRSGNTLIAAWIENGRIAVRRYDLLAQQWDAGAFIPTPTNPFDIDLAVDQNGRAVVAWSDGLLGARLQATRETAPGTWVALGGEIGTRPPSASMVLEFGVHVDTANTIRIAWVEGDANYFVQLAQFNGTNWVPLPGRPETRFQQSADRVRALSVNNEPALFAFAYAVDRPGGTGESFIVVQQLLSTGLASVGSEFQTTHPQIGALDFSMLAEHAATMGQSQATLGGPTPFRLAVRRHLAP